ncbi:hypothetical protein RB623_26210 [Mesorhizobium sp. LHD-90]|uniref:hypothetical protein n=1 Tax=Mesorhizobium sp. LHD-90 TaxID=3071414 RepID=UPI0027DFF551|nr:hypothetical protein [Mesorhizobium sp. LHD-90]MDQ6437562.1 hypothetical protein [Mesorhizobium sp. LHD-90]
MATQKGRRMNWHFDPALSSADYFDLACKRARYGDVPKSFEWVSEHGSFDFGAAPKHVEWLLNQDNWSDDIVKGNRKPRVFIDVYVNQSGNVEIRSIGGHYSIYFDDDFTRFFIIHATAGNQGSRRSLGEIMWMQDFGRLYSYVVGQKNPVAKALLFGFKARMDELVRQISAQVNVVGVMEMQFRYDDRNVVGVDFVPNISKDQIRALQEEMFGDEDESEE